MLETVLERIAVAIEELNALQKVRMEMIQTANRAPEATLAEAPAAEAPVVGSAPAPEAPALDREALLKECRALGVEVPSGTRTTTLAKLVLEARVKVPEAVKAEEEKLEQEMEEAAKPEPAPSKPMTAVEARAILNKEYDGSERDRTILKEALGGVGAARFCDVQDGQFDAVVKTFRTIKKEALRNG